MTATLIRKPALLAAATVLVSLAATSVEGFLARLGRHC
jgi:hypothetical protein